MLNDIMLGVLGNGAYNILKKIILKQIGNEDKAIEEMFLLSIKATTARFFECFGDRFGTPESCFLSIQQNWEVLIQSIFYGTDEIKVEDFVIDGLGLDKNDVLLGAREFLKLLNVEMRKDWQLDKVLTEKRHIIESSKYMKESIEKLSFLENFITGLAEKNQIQKENKSPVIIADLGNKSIENGKKYCMDLDNGSSINYMLTDELIFVEYVFEDGATAYYEVDFSGTLKNSKFPYPLEQYEIDIPEELLLDRQQIKLPNGDVQETLLFRWGKRLTIIKNSNGNILKINAQGEIEVDHRNKRITITRN